MHRRPLLVAGLLALAVGCTHKDKQPPPAVVGGATSTSIASAPATDTTAADTTATETTAPATGTPTSPSSPNVGPPSLQSPTPVDVAADKASLAALVKRTAVAQYDASYDFETLGTRGLVRIVAAPPRYRVDLTVGARSAQFYDIAAGKVNCKTPAGSPAECALVAKPGDKVPEASDIGVQHLFTDGMDALLANPDGYAVAAIAAAPAPGGGKATCFRIDRLADLKPVSPGTVPAPGRGFESGDYCFDPKSAVLTSVRVATGSLTLKQPAGTPSDADFTPPVTPQPLVPVAPSS